MAKAWKSGLLYLSFINVTVLLLSPSFFTVDLVCGQDLNGSYDRINSLIKDKMGKKWYNTDIRPVLDQGQYMNVYVELSLVAVVAIDDVSQKMVTNSFLTMMWRNELVTWNASDYGGVWTLTPDPKRIWRPRLLVINTLGDRDPFKDDYSHSLLLEDGTSFWVPGGLLSTSCHINMRKFPFDVQTCSIQMCPIGHFNNTVNFLVEPVIDQTFYFPNQGWAILSSSGSIVHIMSGWGTSAFSCPKFTFTLERRHTFFILNVILPVILLSFLNNLVFIIPVESGEKISYAITVLLALSVFLGTVSSMMPQASDVVPAVTIYLFVLLFGSCLSVLATIINIRLHHLIYSLEEQQPLHRCHTAGKGFVRRSGTAERANQTPTPSSTQHDSLSTQTSIKSQIAAADEEKAIAQRRQGRNYHRAHTYFNRICFAVFMGYWVTTTFWFFYYVFN